MLLVWISIPFVCKGSGTYGTEVMQKFLMCVSVLSGLFMLHNCLPTRVRKCCSILPLLIYFFSFCLLKFSLTLVDVNLVIVQQVKIR